MFTRGYLDFRTPYLWWFDVSENMMELSPFNDIYDDPTVAVGGITFFVSPSMNQQNGWNMLIKLQLGQLYPSDPNFFMQRWTCFATGIRVGYQSQWYTKVCLKLWFFIPSLWQYCIGFTWWFMMIPSQDVGIPYAQTHIWFIFPSQLRFPSVKLSASSRETAVFNTSPLSDLVSVYPLVN